VRPGEDPFRDLRRALTALLPGATITVTEVRGARSSPPPAGPATGFNHVAIGTQQVMVGTGIPTHRHFQMDESFFILEGSGTFFLNDVSHSFEKGGTIFIPRNSWHGFANPDHELLLLWIVSPPGLDGFFRDTCNPPGMPPRQLTREQLKAIALRYGTEFK